MNRYCYDENYPLEDCNASHICNHPHLDEGQKGWCVGKNGHKGVHQCGRCGSAFSDAPLCSDEYFPKGESQSWIATAHVRLLPLNTGLGETSVPKEIYTREEILQFINERISKYERLARKYPLERREFGDKIDELVTISAILL